MSEPPVHILVLNYNSLEKTAACVASLERLNYRNIRLILLDNDSPDGSGRELQRRFSGSIGEVRGLGLMQGVELVEDETSRDRTPATALTLRLFEETKKRGLLIGKGGLTGNVLRIAPALTVTADEVSEALVLLHESLADAGAREEVATRSARSPRRRP